MVFDEIPAWFNISDYGLLSGCSERFCRYGLYSCRMRPDVKLALAPFGIQHNRDFRFRLVCSDAIARGMDIANVKYVISYETTYNVKTHVHRVGRTARAGKAGTAISLMEKKEVGSFFSISRFGVYCILSNVCTQSYMFFAPFNLSL